jgi:formate-dependent nitrite reductase membrane component NrfD
LSCLLSLLVSWKPNASNSATSRSSAKTIYRGSLTPIFWPVVVVAGVVVPIAIVSFSAAGSLPSLVVSVVLVLTGNLALRYTILRAGMYTSLLP